MVKMHANAVCSFFQDLKWQACNNEDEAVFNNNCFPILIEVVCNAVVSMQAAQAMMQVLRLFFRMVCSKLLIKQDKLTLNNNKIQANHEH